jgi:hypothetical protein
MCCRVACTSKLFCTPCICAHISVQWVCLIPLLGTLLRAACHSSPPGQLQQHGNYYLCLKYYQLIFQSLHELQTYRLCS